MGSVVVQLSHVTLVLGATRIFGDLTWEIQAGQRLGLIGPNGAGKTSILKLITGEYVPEQGGSITRARNITIGYLPQDPEFDSSTSAYQTALQALPRVADIQAELEQIEASLSEAAVYENPKSLARALQKQTSLLEEYHSLGGESYPGLVREMLLRLGLPESDLNLQMGALSGGQKKLVGLARLLLMKPDVLLLDEPDNHLDLPGKVYLERLIREYVGTVVFVSHDRYLLDSVVTHIAEIEDGRLRLFAGDFTGYMVDKEMRLLRQEELYRVQQREIEHLEEAIKRYAIWGKVYNNEKFAARAKAMQKRLDKMEKIEQPVLERRKMDLQLEGWRGSNKVLEMKGVSKAYSGRTILQTINQEIRHGECVGLIGANGSGKSVFLRMVLGLEAPDQGEIIIGPSVCSGYYAQEHETLDFDQSLIDAVRATGKLSESAAVALLIRYLFTYQQCTQKIGNLSGGERSRLQLALLVLSDANFLLLDEPTNNLDIASAEVLEDALVDFVGTVLIISHDRYFLDRTVHRILAIEDGRIVNYPGGYSDYLAIKH